MSKQLSEYDKKSNLSEKARDFIMNYDGGVITTDIKIELKNYLRDNSSTIEQSRVNLIKQFEKVFKQ